MSVPKIIPSNQDDKFKGIKGNFLDAIKKIEDKENNFKKKKNKADNKK